MGNEGKNFSLRKRGSGTFRKKFTELSQNPTRSLNLPATKTVGGGEGEKGTKEEANSVKERAARK